MLAQWTEVLPVFLVKWLARKNCERFNMNGVTVVTARPDVYIRL